MTAAIRPVTTAAYRNPHATLPIPLLRFLVVRNTSDEEIRENIKANAARHLDWVAERPAHDGIAIICGGGPSLEEMFWPIQELRDYSGVVFAGNAASQFLRANDIPVDYQVVGDAKPESAALIDPDARHHLIASQVNPATLDRAIEAGRTTLWHLMSEGVEDLFPPERVKRGGYSLILGSSTVGDFMVRLAYVMGYRELHIFGFDSCHRDGKSHAYPQPMNDTMPYTTVEWGGRSFIASLAMKAQAEKFHATARMLEERGCKLEIYGDGLLQTMYRTNARDLSERDAYRLMWQFDTYRNQAPGEEIVPTFLERVNPSPGSQVIDFGCGTGRASLALKAAGLNPFLVDFADNCRDMEAVLLPFLEADLTQPIPLSAPYGLCTDVMEHIPPHDVPTVLNNILASAQTVFFQINTVPDNMGVLIGRPLHLTVRQHGWWRNWLEEVGAEIVWERKDDNSSLFLVRSTA